MSQQRTLAFSDWIPADSGYRIERRTDKKRGTGQLSGFALDLTIRVNQGEAYFLQDHNGETFPLSSRDDLVEFVVKELERNHEEHFGHI